MSDFDALVLAGGQARRLGGIDKPGVVIGGRTLLDRVLAAVSGARRTVVVGPWRQTCREVVWCREEPHGGGPVPALAAGLAAVTSPTVALLAADLPFLSAECVHQLVLAAPAVVVDKGRQQWLCGAWPTDQLRAAVSGLSQQAGLRLGGVLRPLAPAEIAWEGGDRPWTDCDTLTDVADAEHLARARG